jgi:hypothetical protein
VRRPNKVAGVRQTVKRSRIRSFRVRFWPRLGQKRRLTARLTIQQKSIAFFDLID